MLLDLILILVAAVFAILAGAALLGAGAFVVASLRRWRKARNAGILAGRTAHAARTQGFVALDDPTPDDLMVVADAVAEPDLTTDDLALIRLLSYSTFDDDYRVTLPSGRVITGATMAALIRRHGQEPSATNPFDAWLSETYPDSAPTIREKRIPVPARPNELGNWVRIGDERVHRSCEQAYPAGLVCSYCLPILLVHARSVAS